MFYTFIPSRHVNIPCDANILIVVSLMTSVIAERERERATLIVLRMWG